jgi:hypothetical protein
MDIWIIVLILIAELIGLKFLRLKGLILVNIIALVFYGLGKMF